MACVMQLSHAGECLADAASSTDIDQSTLKSAWVRVEGSSDEKACA